METRSDEQLLQDLDGADEYVRSSAAVELARRMHPRALEACLRTLDDGAGPAHADITPSLFCLAAMGMRAWPALLEKLAAPDPMTRLHAERAVGEIGKRQFGFDGLRWPGGACERWSAWWQHVAYRYDADDAERARAIERLRAYRFGA